MACASTQPTLPTTDSDLAHYARSLGFLRVAAWYSFERSTTIQAPLSTGPALTQQLFRSLEDVGVFCIPQTRCRRIRRSIYEPLAWCYPVDWGDPLRLPSILLTALQELSAHDGSGHAKVELWDSLASAEIETYLAHLLRRHTLNPADAHQIVREMGEEWAEHSLARRRYLVWSATRGAAAALLRTGMDHDAARSALLNEMRRRSRWLAAKQAANTLPKHEFSFVPGPHWRRPILLDVLMTVVLGEEDMYWVAVPEDRWLPRI